MTRPLPPLSKADKEHLANGSKWDLIQAVVIGVDQLAREMELTWGSSRLIALVSDETRESFRRGSMLWSKAIADSDLEAVRTLGPKMIRAWQVMAREADARGFSPLAPEVFETRLADGRVLAVVRTAAEAVAIAQNGRAMLIFTMEELGRVLPQLDLINSIKQEWPGAVVSRVVRHAENLAEDWATDSWKLDLHEVEEV